MEGEMNKLEVNLKKISVFSEEVDQTIRSHRQNINDMSGVLQLLKKVILLNQMCEYLKGIHTYIHTYFQF